MGVTFLFWNINKQQLQDRVASLCHDHDVDVFLLAECPSSNNFETQLLTALSRETGQEYNLIGVHPGKVRFYSRIASSRWDDIRRNATGSLSIQRLISREIELLVGAVHLPSRATFSEEDQTLEATQVASEIRGAEALVGHADTVLLGDFNMDPFHKGMVASHAFHALMTADLAKQRGGRIVQGNSYPAFYNPMWGRLGDQTPGSPGTFHFDGTGRPVSYYWHTYDQILMRPGVLPYFSGDFGSIDAVRGEPILLRSSDRDRITEIDHVPVFVRLNLTLEG